MAMQAIGRKQSALKLYFSGRIEGLSVYHHVLMAFSGWLLFFTLIDDTYQITGIPNIKPEDLYLLGLAIFFISFFFVFPCAAAVWGVYHIKNNDYRLKGRFPRLRLVAIIGSAFSSFVACVLCPLAIFIFVDMFAAITVIPLATAFCGTLWILFSLGLTQEQPLRKRATIITAMLLLILSIKFIDWNYNKSLARDRFQIRKGMIGIEVERIMGRYQKNFIQPESENYLHLNIEYTGTSLFSAWDNDTYLDITFQDGRVVNVEIVGD